ncbi:VPLPA-CTERM sorting domain-containing protein [Qingshengfaniella alkalisoli]|uniref:VPLPA-CTERM sorting domain-containing protein n=1 Tax=Qingshengfaniella alkalisoli TaxID=2599296 RepID=UPI00143D10A7|nr:VPLPA-CTERM sorting domain-containing protein [Qingshengfaniella alkalisoli]
MLALVLIQSASSAAAATIHEWGQGYDGPSRIYMKAERVGDRVGQLFHDNAINWGAGVEFSTWLDFEGFGRIEVGVDTTNNGGCTRGCPDSMRILTLPDGVRASAMYASTEEDKTGVIEFFVDNPELTTPTTAVPLPASALFLVAGIGAFGAVRKRKSKS